MNYKKLADMVLIPPGSIKLGSNKDTTSYQTVTGKIINVTKALDNKFEVEEDAIPYVTLETLELPKLELSEVPKLEIPSLEKKYPNLFK